MDEVTFNTNNENYDVKFAISPENEKYTRNYMNKNIRDPKSATSFDINVNPDLVKKLQDLTNKVDKMEKAHNRMTYEQFFRGK